MSDRAEAPTRARRGLVPRKPRTPGQWVWLVLCAAWVAFALLVVVWTTVYTWDGANADEDFVLLGQLVVAAPASWLAFVPAFFLPQEPIGPNGGGGIGDGWFVAIQVLTCVLVVVQGWLIHLLGSRLAGASRT